MCYMLAEQKEVKKTIEELDSRLRKGNVCTTEGENNGKRLLDMTWTITHTIMILTYMSYVVL